MSLKEALSASEKYLIYRLAKILESPEACQIWSKTTKPIIQLKASKYDIRHKETLRLCLKEYFQRWIPSLVPYIKFEIADFKDKELISIFEDEDTYRIADALIVVEMTIGQTNECIMIYYRAILVFPIIQDGVPNL